MMHKKIIKMQKLVTTNKNIWASPKIGNHIQKWVPPPVFLILLLFDKIISQLNNIFEKHKNAKAL